MDLRGTQGNSRNQIDFIITDEIRTNRDVSVFSKFRMGGHHRMIRAEIVVDPNDERLKFIRIYQNKHRKPERKNGKIPRNTE